jgi:Putative 2OG-Fe(II) oxygenase
LSGVYYARVQPGADTINFLDPRPQTGIIRPPVTTLTAENTEQVVVKITCGTLLMFPAWLQHAVDPNRSDRLRVSIGFNIMFPAYAEVMTRPLWTPGRRPSGEPQSITRRRHRRQTTNVADLSVGANL